MNTFFNVLGILCYVAAFVMLILYLVFDIGLYSRSSEMRALLLFVVLAGGALQGIGNMFKNK